LLQILHIPLLKLGEKNESKKLPKLFIVIPKPMINNGKPIIK